MDGRKNTIHFYGTYTVARFFFKPTNRTSRSSMDYLWQGFYSHFSLDLLNAWCLEHVVTYAPKLLAFHADESHGRKVLKSHRKNKSKTQELWQELSPL